MTHDPVLVGYVEEDGRPTYVYVPVIQEDWPANVKKGVAAVRIGIIEDTCPECGGRFDLGRLYTGLGHYDDCVALDTLASFTESKLK